MGCALWGRRIVMIITTKFPRIRNGLSSRSCLLMFLSVGAAWGGHKQMSPRCHTGIVTQGAAEQNGISGLRQNKIHSELSESLSEALLTSLSVICSSARTEVSPPPIWKGYKATENQPQNPILKAQQTATERNSEEFSRNCVH